MGSLLCCMVSVLLFLIEVDLAQLATALSHCQPRLSLPRHRTTPTLPTSQDPVSAPTPPVLQQGLSPAPCSPVLPGHGPAEPGTPAHPCSGPSLSPERCPMPRAETALVPLAALLPAGVVGWELLSLTSVQIYLALSPL